MDCEEDRKAGQVSGGPEQVIRVEGDTDGDKD